jgi:hypothetical protein
MTDASAEKKGGTRRMDTNHPKIQPRNLILIVALIAS